MTRYALNPMHDRKMQKDGETSKGSIGTVGGGSRGDLFYYDDLNDTWFKANHTSEANCKGMLGLLLGDSTTQGEFLLSGLFKTTGLNTASTYFVGPTDGSISTSEPDTEDYVLRVVGYARSSAELIFNPSDDYYTLGADSDDDVQIMMQTLEDILKTLKIINLHMSLVTDEHITNAEVS